MKTVVAQAYCGDQMRQRTAGPKPSTRHLTTTGPRLILALVHGERARRDPKKSTGYEGEFLPVTLSPRGCSKQLALTLKGVKYVRVGGLMSISNPGPLRMGGKRRKQPRLHLVWGASSQAAGVLKVIAESSDNDNVATTGVR